MNKLVKIEYQEAFLCADKYYRISIIRELADGSKDTVAIFQSLKKEETESACRVFLSAVSIDKTIEIIKK